MKSKTGLRLALSAVASTALLLTPSAGAAPSNGPDVRISELANGGPGGSSDEFIELANFGDEPADLDGWAIYRCTGRADRHRDPQVPEFSGVRLEPGETYLIAHPDSTVADIADTTEVISGFADEGFGFVLEDSQRRIVDAVPVYAHTIHSDCGDSGPDNLPNSLDFARAQSYQRVATTGSVSADFIAAARTPGEANATSPDPGPQRGDVLVSELTNGGPGGSEDDFVELANFGNEPVDVGGWQVYRCQPPGLRHRDYLQLTVPSGVVLAPGEVFVAAHESVDVPGGVRHARYQTSLDDAGFGALIENRDGDVMDAVGVFETDGVHQRPTDSPCTQGTALPNRLDFGLDQTYQRFQDTGDNAADFAQAERSIGELAEPDPADGGDAGPSELGPVRISELTHSGPGGADDNFFELANYGDEPVSLRDWTVYRCGADGRRVPEPQIPVIGDVTLAPGETFLAVREGSPLHDEGRYDATYSASLSDEQFGIVVHDPSGAVVDSVGVAHESTGSVTYVACAMGISLRNTLLSRAGNGYSFQRLRATGSNVDDFVPAPRTPGEVDPDLRAPGEFTDEELEPVDVPAHPRALPAEPVGPDDGAADVGEAVDLTVTAGHTTGEDVDVTFYGARQHPIRDRGSQVFTGVSQQTPPAVRQPPGETRVARDRHPFGTAARTLSTDATDGFPYQRYQVLVEDRLRDDQVEIAWSGRSVGSNELQMYVWNHDTGAWQLVDAASGRDGGDISLLGTVDVDTAVRGRRVDVLVQDGPATEPAFSSTDDEPNQGFKDTGEYDFAFGHLSDTQYLSEGYRDVYAEMSRWLVTRQDARKIAYTFHTGDLIQQWFGDHLESRAREQFGAASDMMSVLEDAGHPYGVLPGNHDNRHGRSNDLYNDYFGPDRFEDQPWYGDSWRPDDNRHHYDVFEVGGAKFLMVYLGYFGATDETPDESLQWAADVIAAHPDHNVVVATHDYLLPDGTLSTRDTESATCGSGGTSACSRWNHIADRYWNELVLPHENVFLVLSGHRHSVATTVKRDVGGEDGRTVVEMTADYSFHEHDGLQDTGFLRLLQIDVDAKTLAVNTYSPTLDEHNAGDYDPLERYDDADDEFVVEIDLNDTYDKRVEADQLVLQTPAEVVGTSSAGDGGAATVTWDGLAPDTPYTWYTVTRDAGGMLAGSPVRTFTTGNREQSFAGAGAAVIDPYPNRD